MFYSWLTEIIALNNDTQVTDFTDIDKLELKKSSATQQAAKKITKNTEI